MKAAVLSGLVVWTLIGAAVGGAVGGIAFSALVGRALVGRR